MNLAHGWNLEAAIAALLGLWLLATGRGNRRDGVERRLPDPRSSAGYLEKLRRFDRRDPARLWAWRLAGLILAAGGIAWLIVKGAE